MTPSALVRISLATATLFLAAALPARAQVTGAKNVVINQIQPDQGDGLGLSVELYNYGPAQLIGGYHLEFQLDNGASTTASGYLFPAGFTLGRHAFAVVHWAAGADGAVQLYRGNSGSPALTPDGELRLCSATCAAANGVDYVLWGAPSPTHQLTNLAWSGSVPFGSGAAQGYIQRQRDLNTRDAGDWTTVQHSADAALNPGQIGTRRHGRVMINEAFLPGRWIELYNPNPFPVPLVNATLTGYAGGAVCQIQPLGGFIMPAGFVTTVTLGSCGWGAGEVKLTDAGGEGIDYLSFSTPAHPNLPSDLRWTGAELPAAAVIARGGDLDSDNTRDWGVTANTSLKTLGVLNAGQQGVHAYDELGAEQYNFTYSVPGRGNQLTVTKPFFLREWKLRAAPTAGVTGVYLAIYQQSGANWNRIYQNPLGVQSADGSYSTGQANLAIYPGVYRFMIYNDANFVVWSGDPLEGFAYGTYGGVANEAAGNYPPPVTTPMGAFNAAGAVIQQFFLSDPGPAISTTSPLAPCNTGTACSRPFAASGTGALSWSYTGAAIPGMSLNAATGLLSGYPTAQGTYNFTITVTDANGMTDSKPFMLVVNFLYTPIAITTASVPGGTLNMAYSAPLAATGGDGTYTWSLVSGALPAGVGIDPAGAIYGEPFAAGAFGFTVQVTDGQGASASKALSLVVSNALHIINTSIPTGYNNIAYSPTAIVAAGGSGSYTYALDATSAALPAGMSFVAGTLSGTPTAKGIFNLVFRATDTVSFLSVIKPLPLTVGDKPLLAQWEGRGLFGGDVNTLVPSPNFTTDSTAFAGGPLFEGYRSDDSGATWTRKIIDPVYLSQTIDRMVISPNFNSAGATTAEKTLFVMNGGLGVYRSVNRGDSFSTVNTGLPGVVLGGGKLSGLVISPDYASDSRLWIAYTNTATVPGQVDIYATVNGGNSWAYYASISNASFSFRYGQLFISPTFSSDSTMFALVGYGVGGTQFLRSSDGGLSWATANYPGATSCGTSATTIRNVILSPRYAVDRAVFVEDSCGVIARSLDAGATFTTLSQHGAALAALARPGQTPLWYLKNGNAMYGLSMSDNYGDSFTALFAGGLRSNFAAFVGPQRTLSVIAPVRRADGSIFLLAASDKGVDGSFDAGDSFNPRERGIAALHMGSAFSLGVRGYAGKLAAAETDHWLYSADSGLHWIQRLPPWPIDAQGRLGFIYSVAIAPTGTGTLIFIAGQLADGTSQLYRSADGGLNFTPVSGIPVAIEDMAFSSTGATMFLGTQSGLYRSTDSGVSFIALTSLANNNICTPGGDDEVRSVALSPNFSTDNTLFVGTLAPCRSVDGGATWTAVAGVPGRGRIAPSSAYNQLAASNANNAWTLYVGGYTGMQRSLDRGATWSTFTLPTAGFYWTAIVSPAQSTDHKVFAYCSGPGPSLYASSNDGATFAPLAGGDQLLTRPVTGLEFVTGTNGGTALAATDGGGMWRSSDGAQTFSGLSDYQFLSAAVNGMAAVPITGGVAGLAAARNKLTPATAATLMNGSLLAATGDAGVFISNDDGQTFDVFSNGLTSTSPVTNFTDIHAIAVGTNALNQAAAVAIAVDPAVGATGAKVFRYSGGSWVTTVLPPGAYNRLDDTGGTALYATRLDGLTQRSGDGGVSWSAVDGSGPNNIASVSYSSLAGPTTLTAGAEKSGPPAPQTTTAVTAAYWSVSATAGARYDATGTGAAWTAAPGSNDYTLPVLSGTPVSSYKIVQTLGINAVSGGREVLAGTTGDLYLSRDGGVTWRSVSGTGSGLEATSKNFAAVLATSTAYGTTDLLVGATGAVTGGVYLSGDAGEHWTQLNAGFDPANLSISSLVTTSCAGCPVQYYSGSYGGGLYTRTISVAAPPFYTAAATWCAGSTACTCASATATLPVSGGQAFRICGSNFQAGAAVEFDGVPATGCTVPSATVITCTGSPAHVAGGATVRVRNPDTRAKFLPAGAYQFSGGAPRAANSLHIAKAAADAALTWSCAGCTAGAPARVYRSQNVAFNLYLEQYNGGTGGAYTNSGAVGSAQNYFWTVE